MIKPTLAIIGYGEFAKFMIKRLCPYFDIVVTSRRPITDRGGLNFRPVDLETALAQELIIPSMPSQLLKDFFEKHRADLNPKALIIDVCSVKVAPIKVLQKVLPKTCQILATHPMFGPGSVKNGLVGQPIMIYSVRLTDKSYQKIKKFLKETLKLKVIETTPEKHDQMMAYAQGLSHYIGRAMQLMDIPSGDMTTKAYNDLLDMKVVQGKDSAELFQSIMLDNPFALEVNKKFKRTLKELDRKLGIK